MIPGIEPLYQQLAESMVDAIPEDWASAKFEAIFYPSGSIYEAEYIRSVDGKARGFQPSSDGSRAFRQLRRLFQDQGRPMWGRAYFELHPDGRFDLKLGYDDCDENGYARFDEDTEVARHEARRKRLSS